MLNKFSLHIRDKSMETAPAGGLARLPLKANMLGQLRLQFAGLKDKVLDGYTFEKKPSRQHGARDDLAIFDEAGVTRFLGRTFDGKSIYFWRP